MLIRLYHHHLHQHKADKTDTTSVQTTDGPPLETQLFTLEIDDPPPATGSFQELLKDKWLKDCCCKQSKQATVSLTGGKCSVHYGSTAAMSAASAKDQARALAMTQHGMYSITNCLHKWGQFEKVHEN